MQAKEAVFAAKAYIAELMSDEAIELPTLEEVWLDEKKRHWLVTLAIRRRLSPETAAGKIGLAALPTYKTVTISDVDGSFVSIRSQLLKGLASSGSPQSTPTSS